MDERVSNECQLFSVKRYILTDGKESGLKVIECDNGKIRFLLNESKALDIMQLFHMGQNISFVSKNGFSLREREFSSRFEGGMLYTCGLDSVGARKGYELHGSLHNTPAKVSLIKCEENGIMIEGKIENTELFGQNLTLKRRIFTEIGSDKVELTDTLINDGYTDEQYCILYHVNIGYPLLDEGAELQDETQSVVARTEWAKEHINERNDITFPTYRNEEMCYFLKLKKPQISLVNKKIGKTFTLSYSNDTLPHVVQWKSMSSGDYALGLEPSTTELDDNFKYTTLKAKEKISFTVSFKITK